MTLGLRLPGASAVSAGERKHSTAQVQQNTYKRGTSMQRHSKMTAAFLRGGATAKQLQDVRSPEVQITKMRNQRFKERGRYISPGTEELKKQSKTCFLQRKIDQVFPACIPLLQP